jgi:hypothetical protein
MSVQPLDLTGGKSVYCLNQGQLDQALALAAEASQAGARIRAAVARLESDCSRNERAAIAFVLIRHLQDSAEAAAATDGR